MIPRGVNVSQTINQIFNTETHNTWNKGTKDLNEASVNALLNASLEGVIPLVLLIRSYKSACCQKESRQEMCPLSSQLLQLITIKLMLSFMENEEIGEKESNQSVLQWLILPVQLFTIDN